jgi:hypothetical protein
MGMERLCLFEIISTSWRLRGVKRPPYKEATESSHKGAPAKCNRGSLIRQNENPARSPALRP